MALNEAGAIAWPDWAARFSPRVRDAAPEAYWQAWAETLAALLAERGIASGPEIDPLTRRWQAAARATPHGQPVTLTGES